jgi:drug/metabolite transporter (DMT)-like permease
MTTLALLIVLTSAFLHAFWNLLVKRANGGLALLWLVFAWMVVAFAPVAIYVFAAQRPALGPAELVAMAGNGVLQLTYFYLLDQGYRFGDLSLVYPLARGSGPLLVLIYAVAVLGEQPTPLAVGGAVMVAAGVLLLSLDINRLRASGSYKGVVYALLTGASIAIYTLWDRHAVHDLKLNPLLYLWAGSIGQLLIVAPYAARHRDQVAQEWRAHWKSAAGIGVISIAAYALILFALTFSPVSYIAPAREISVLLGTAMGSRVLAEEFSARRIVAAAAMVLGLVGLALG